MTRLILPPELRPQTVALLEEIARERIHQDSKHGGPEHDDRHSREQWFDLLASRAMRFRTGADGDDDANRRHLIEISALALAIVESLDRKSA